MKSLLNTGTMTVEFRVSEDELRARLLQEAKDALQMPDAAGGHVLRGDGRKGGYVVRITREVHPSLPAPRAKA